MTTNNDGGPAFPQNDASVNRINNHDGMSLRDWFAGNVAQGIVAGFVSRSKGEISELAVALDAYAIADAMLAERAKKGATNA